MSQNIDLSTVNNKISSTDEFDNSNNHCESTSDVTVVNQSNHNDWANFDAFETNHNSECISKTTNSNDADDDWADFQSNTEHSVELANEKDDEVSNSSTSFVTVNCLNVEQIDKLLSTCFPLESPILSTDTDLSFSLELPTFTTFKDPAKQLPSLQPTLRLWNALSSIPNDPIGVQYQWRKSNIEHLFHTALGFQNKTIPTTTNSSVDEFQHNDMGHSLTDVINSSEIDDNLFDVSTTPDIDYYIPSKLTSSSNAEPIRRTNSPIPPIKTTGLFPGSTTVLNDEPKFVVNSPSNLTFINPKALMSSVQLTPESTI